MTEAAGGSADAAELAYIDCVPTAARETLLATCGVSPREATAEDLPETGGSIIAIISLVGDVEWSLFLGLPEQVATAMAAKFAGFEIPFDSEDMGDAVGELMNILVGHVKALLDRDGAKVEISLPSIHRGDNAEVIVPPGAHSATYYYACDHGAFWVGVLSDG